MKIIDIKGKVIEVKNLDLALLQADDYRYFRHTDPAFYAMDAERQTYWEDIYQKLLKLKLNEDNG